jgi:predicted nucleotidyltransferase
MMSKEIALKWYKQALHDLQMAERNISIKGDGFVNDMWLQRFEIKVLPVLVSEFKPESVIIFGSRITGKAFEGSDIDVLIISDFFKDIPFIKRMPMVLRTARFEKHVDYICYTPTEFENIKDKSSIIMDALENGRKVA